MLVAVVLLIQFIKLAVAAAVLELLDYLLLETLAEVAVLVLLHLYLVQLLPMLAAAVHTVLPVAVLVV
jgi:hypothetical protein